MAEAPDAATARRPFGRGGEVGHHLWPAGAVGSLGYTGSRVSMREMTVYGVSFDLVGKQPIVLLKTADGDKVLPVWIGHPEAASILMKLQGQEAPRPQTHDLLADVIVQLD